MSAEPPVIQGKTPSPESLKLIEFFDELEKHKLEFLDKSGKRLVELCSALLGVLFAILAFGDKFPPPYLVENTPAKALMLCALLFYLPAMICGFIVFAPRSYKKYHYNITELVIELEKMVNHKVYWFRLGSVLFGAGSVSLTLLIILIILSVK